MVRIFTGGLGLYTAGTITWEMHQLIAEGWEYVDTAHAFAQY